MQTKIIVTFDSGDTAVTRDLHELIERVAPYMVDNVHVTTHYMS
jgi:hypothetical protein